MQTKGFHDAMKPERTLLVRKPQHQLDCEERPDWYPDATHVDWDTVTHSLPQREVMEWLDGLDVVFTAETPYDWRLPDWARTLGVKTVIQGNPEFYRLDQEGGCPHPNCDPQPTAWWWPTPWRLDRLPTGRVMPVPMPDTEFTARKDGPVRFLHVVGKRAWEDRNGTDIVLAALRAIESEVEFTVQGFGWELDETHIRQTLGLQSPLKLKVDVIGVADRWSMYADHSMLVYPRRYGGNALPALEAAACGLAVMMPDVSPNEVYATEFMSARGDRSIRVAAGVIPVADVDFRQLARRIDELAANPDAVRAQQQTAFNRVPRWSEYEAIYREELERICQLP